MNNEDQTNVSTKQLGSFSGASYTDNSGNVYLSRWQGEGSPPKPPLLFNGRLIVISTVGFTGGVNIEGSTSVLPKKNNGAPYDDTRRSIYWETDFSNLDRVIVQDWHEGAWRTQSEFPQGSPGYYTMDFHTIYRVLSVWSLAKTYSLYSPRTNYDPNNVYVLEEQPYFSGGSPFDSTSISNFVLSEPQFEITLTNEIELEKFGTLRDVRVAYTAPRFAGSPITLEASKVYYNGLNRNEDSAISVAFFLGSNTFTNDDLTVTRFNGISIE